MNRTLPTLKGARCTLRPMETEEAPTLAAALADDRGARPWLGGDPAVIERWTTDADVSVFVVMDDADEVGLVSFEEQSDPDYVSASIDIALLEGGADRGLGPDAIRALARWLFDSRGHHRITIDPAVANERAIRAYEKVGFRPVGVMRQYERTPGGDWHDNLLMDLLKDELTETEVPCGSARV